MFLFYEHSAAVEGDPRYSPPRKIPRPRAGARARRDGEFAKSRISVISKRLCHIQMSQRREASLLNLLSHFISHIKMTQSWDNQIRAYPNVSKKRGINDEFTKSFYQSYQNDSVISKRLSHIKTTQSWDNQIWAYPNVSKKGGSNAEFTKSFYQSYQNDSVMRQSDMRISKCL